MARSRGRLRHGQAVHPEATPEYRAWVGMRQRCENPDNGKYLIYGGRGIKVCDRWQVFENFFADMGSKPTPLHSLDRYPNPNGDYEPANCRWATAGEQSRNRRSNRLVRIDGKRMPLAAVVELYDADYGLVAVRLRRGWPLRKALTHPKISRSEAGSHGARNRWGA